MSCFAPTCLRHSPINSGVDSAPSSARSAASGLFDAAVGVVDEYLTQGEEDSVFVEAAFQERNNDLGGFLKSERLGKGDYTPHFVNLMAINKRTMGRGNPSPRDLITQAIK